MSIFLGLVVTLLPALAAAQAPPPVTPPRAPAPSLDPWESYHVAFLRLARGDRDGARELLTEIAAEHADHPAAAFATARLTELGAAIEDSRPIDPLREERPTRGARGELVLGQTLHAMIVAAEVCVIAGCDGARATAAASLIGVGGGLAASLYLTKEGITSGHADALNSGYIWGAINAFLVLNNVADPSDREVAGTLLASQIAGMAVGELAYRAWRPTAGHVAAANTAGMWTAILVMLGQGAAEMDFNPELVVGMADAGIVVGGFMSARFPMSRGRAYLIDTGGIVGFLAGGLVAVGVDDEQTAFTALFGGTAAGLVAAVVMTRDWDAPDPPPAPRMAITPMRDGWGATLVFDLP